MSTRASKDHLGGSGGSGQQRRSGKRDGGGGGQSYRGTNGCLPTIPPQKNVFSRRCLPFEPMRRGRGEGARKWPSQAHRSRSAVSGGVAEGGPAEEREAASGSRSRPKSKDLHPQKPSQRKCLRRSIKYEPQRRPRAQIKGLRSFKFKPQIAFSMVWGRFYNVVATRSLDIGATSAGTVGFQGPSVCNTLTPLIVI
jgi:hypothetical protein